VQVWINEGGRSRTDLALELERVFGLDEAIVVPLAETEAEAAKSVGLALGKFLTEGIADGMSIGVGWGRTLTASLTSLRPVAREGVRIVSLCGGVIEAPRDNPTDFSWRLASRIGAECLLYPAPLLVDSPETRDTLRERCGLDRVERIAAALDVALFSCRRCRTGLDLTVAQCDVGGRVCRTRGGGRCLRPYVQHSRR
jgi:DNA-binding transcriptional regulator LsrR (DeoR family)